MTLRRRELILFRKQLLGWFRAYQRDLPWRRTKDPYCIWLSEIMLQQTRVAAVIPYYERFLQRFPDIQTLAAAPEEDVLRWWSGLGYYSRARNLQRAARQIVATHGGVFPRKHTDALGLAGIGNYTAAAILSIAFGAKHAVLDGNVARVLARVFAVRGDLREARRWQGLQGAADALLDPATPGEWNQTMMELGATVCTPQAPQCLVCPVSKFCQARKLGLAESLPDQRKKRATIEVTLASAVIMDSRARCLLLSPSPQSQKALSRNGQKEPQAETDVHTLVSRMWHFPTIAVKADAEVELRKFLQTLSPEWLRNSRKVRVRLPSNDGATITRTTPKALGTRFEMKPLPKVRHTVTYRRIIILPFCVRMQNLPRVAGARIASLEQVTSTSSLAISNLTRKIARTASAQLETSASCAGNTRGGELFTPSRPRRNAPQGESKKTPAVRPAELLPA